MGGDEEVIWGLTGTYFSWWWDLEHCVEAMEKGGQAFYSSLARLKRE